MTEQNRNFYIPYEANFSEGEYTASLSADGEPPAEVMFAVQYPIVESAEEKSRRIGAFTGSVLPGNTETQPGAPPTPGAGLFRLSKVVTCEDAQSWGVYQQKSIFHPGDRLCVYAEAWNVNGSGQINLLFAFTISDQNQQVFISREVPVAVRSSDPSWASWQYFNLPSDLQPGSYTVRVNARNNLTGASSSQEVAFSVPTT